MPQMTIPVVRVGRTRKGKGDHIRYEGGTGAGGYWLRLIVPSAECEGLGQVDVTFNLPKNGNASVRPQRTPPPATRPAAAQQDDVELRMFEQFRAFMRSQQALQ